MNYLSKSILAVITIMILFLSCNENSAPSVPCNTTAEKSHSTDPKIVELQKAMVAFRQSLSTELLAQASVCLNHERFYLWHNTPANSRGKRDGIIYGDLNAEQLGEFKRILQLFLSAKGYKKVNDITVLSEGWLSNIKSEIWNPDFYSIDMFGEPEKSGSWGFQLDGHHCVVNFLVHGDNVSIVPAFLGGEPAAETYNGTAFDIFKNERDLAIAFYNNMNAEEIKVAVSSSSSRSLEVGPASRSGKPDPYWGAYDYSGFKTGLKYADMSAATKASLVILMKEYVYNLNNTFADKWWADIMENIDETYFVWIDNVDRSTAQSQFYYRIYNPYLWAEFNTEDVTGPNAKTMDEWNHVHTITRIPFNPSTKNGGDYGDFAQVINQNGVTTLYEHYASADHHQMSEMLFDYKIIGIQMESHSHTGEHAHHKH